MAADKKGNTAIHSASNTCAPDSLELMLKNGGDVNVLNHFHNTPLHKCCKYGAAPCLPVLLKYGTATNTSLAANDFLRSKCECRRQARTGAD